MWDIITDLKANSLKKILKILLVKNFIIGCSKKKNYHEKNSCTKE